LQGAKAAAERSAIRRKSSAAGKAKRASINCSWSRIRKLRSRLTEGAIEMNATRRKRGAWSWWYLLFALQFVAVLWPPFYNKVEPSWMGVPFFYWYQLLWVPISAVTTAVIYLATDD
jgi:Protein of unknown function (DUF3311)